MATLTPKKVSVNIKLRNGVDDQGNVKTVTVNLGKLSLTGYDDAKAYALVGLLTPCLDKQVHTVERVKIDTLTA